MNERDEFLRSTQAFFTRYIDRIASMSEAEVIRALHGLQTARESQTEILSHLKSVSLTPPEDPHDEINKLRSQLSSKTRAGVNPFALSDSIEDALMQRLEKLRGQGR